MTVISLMRAACSADNCNIRSGSGGRKAQNIAAFRQPPVWIVRSEKVVQRCGLPNGFHDAYPPVNSGVRG